MKTAAIAVAAAMLAGCAWSSGVLEVGPDTYQVSANAAPVRGGITGARKQALTKANQKCDGLGKQIEVVDIQNEYGFPANGVATVTFRCI